MINEISSLKNRLFRDDLPIEVRIFNGIHGICAVTLIVVLLLIGFFFPNSRALMGLFCAAGFAVFTLYEGNRTEKYELCSIVMSCVLNIILFPMLYFEFGSATSGIMICFIFGLIYNAMVFTKIKGIIISSIDIICYITIICTGSYMFSHDFVCGGEKLSDYIALCVGIFTTSISGGMAIRYRVVLHNREQEKLERLHVEAMNAYVSKDIFLVNMSHEIRTPMNAIVGTVDILLEQEINDHVKECVYNIINSSNALLSLTDEIMDLSKSNSDEIVLFNARYDVRNLMMEIINMIAVRLMDSGVKLVVEIDESIPRYLYGDSSKLRQVFINILNNAVKYTKQGKITLRVYYEAINETEILLKTDVEDTGIGIKPEYIPHLFDMFRRGDVNDEGVESAEGTGIGLAICKEIVEEMEGKISVTSSYNVGSTFSFYVPQQIDSYGNIVIVDNPEKYNILIYVDDDDECIALKHIFDNLNIASEIINERYEIDRCFGNKYSHVFISVKRYNESFKTIDKLIKNEKLVILADISESVSLKRSGFIMTRPIHVLNVAAVLTNESSTYAREISVKKKFKCPNATILVVDDNLTNLNVASGLLRKYEANVLTALSGKECLNILEKSHVDLIFLDYMMPEMNGIDTLENIREMNDGALIDVPVVALTANVVNGAREMFLESGFDEFISKPIDINKIEKTIKALLPQELIMEECN